MNRKIKTSISRNKKKFKEESILIHFNYKKSVIINTNTSECIMRACLQQIDNQEWKWLIVYYAWKLMFTEQWYNVHDWEITKTTQKNQVIYKIKHLKKILQNIHQKK